MKNILSHFTLESKSNKDEYPAQRDRLEVRAGAAIGAITGF